ncbi:membrane protein YqaA, SNARE-associated domain [Desulfatibacillum alkenivorans DSM 16219]|jgi:membrane protein YqaA with SNARE-associated domain|uniref:Membrane protein YqaA, SNARE-associated domain n=1 Tax=Desulfatibacillum alkenivorans DSM 16219 TaxID=1121393 RepID=A0A1M7AG77_9BACT|nr:YqaA family protein [Desulfatibacillum alkenivorans]SHL41793.1 membrane protein YqaA, SNARE-associated domain [Desulfatibacillum alkenivorans DSM 16219]
MLKRLYNWVIGWAESPHGVWALAILAFAESSFFPIPPDALLIVLALGMPKKAFKFAAYCSVGSILGGMFGYFLGWQFMDAVGFKIIEFYHLTDKYAHVQELYATYDAWITFAAGFTPIPYKLFTIAGGAFKINFPVFCLASAISRSARFFLVAACFYYFGPAIKPYIDKYFNLLAVIFTIMLIGGFVLIKYLM